MKRLPKYISFLKENRTRDQAVDIYKQRIKDSEEIFDKFSENFVERECPICGETSFNEVESFNDQYGVVECCKCSSIYVNPSPNLEALDYYYNHCDCNKQLGSLLKSRVGKYGVILNERTSHVLEIIQGLLHLKSSISILEIGCHSGAFLSELKEALISKGIFAKVSLFGIDIDESAIQNQVDNDISLFHSSAEGFLEKTESRFDLILHFELIEHLHNPFEFCCAINKLLNINGLMYFHTPNALGLENQALSYNDFRPIAHGIFPPMHLNSFTTQNVSHFLIRCGFSVRKIETPGNFDVDIIMQFCSDNNELAIIKNIEDAQSLAILQFILKKVGASSHLAVLAAK